MPFIGTQPDVGGYSVLDNLTASATASYTLQKDSANFVPSSANQLLVSLNGVIQKPGTSFTVSGSTLTFSSALTSSDSIDFILAMGEPLLVGTPSDGTVVANKLATNAVTTAKLATNAVSTAKIAADAVTTAKLATNAVRDELPAGSVIQTLQTVDGAVSTYSTTETWTDMGSLSVTITPQFANSKIMVEYHVHNSTSDATVAHRILRGSTAVGIGTPSGSRFGVTTRTGRIRGGDENHLNPPASMKFLDSPNTTSATTYKVQIRLQTGESGITMNTAHNQPAVAYTYGSVTISTITVSEIKQ